MNLLDVTSLFTTVVYMCSQVYGILYPWQIRARVESKAIDSTNTNICYQENKFVYDTII